jgi:hypothetical protein
LCGSNLCACHDRVTGAEVYGIISNCGDTGAGTNCLIVDLHPGK